MLYRLKKDHPCFNAGRIFVQRITDPDWFEVEVGLIPDYSLGAYFPLATRTEWLEEIPDEAEIEKAKKMLEDAGYEVMKK